MKKVIIGIGIPGSGKTTLLKRFASKYEYSYICPDDIRTELTGNPSDQTKNKEVWEETHKRVLQIMKTKTVVVDATFASVDQRKSFLDLLRSNGAEKIEGIFVNTPLEIAKERNANRDRFVPEHVLEKMSHFLSESVPNINDGFDSLFTFDENKMLKSLEVKKS